jgi:uncharacterized membrane protein
VLLVGAAYAILPESLRLGPHILLLGVVVVLLVLIASARLRGHPRLTRLLALSLITVVTVAVVASVLLLVSLLLLRQEVVPPPTLLRDAALVWIINVVTFAVWYWEIDGGGPAQRRKDAHESSDFLFPQMAQEEGKAASSWSPQFVDYLFLAFNHSTAFSPTDTAVLSRRAKVLTMTQASLSLLVVAVLVARAINAL